MNPTYLKYKEKKKQDKIIAKRTKSKAKKKKSNDDKPKEDYKKICLQSRWFDICDTVYCDLCWAVACDVHHIIWWPSRKRLYSDPYNLSILCRPCHHKITFEWANTQDMKENLLEIAKNKLLFAK